MPKGKSRYQEFVRVEHELLAPNGAEVPKEALRHYLEKGYQLVVEEPAPAPVAEPHYVEVYGQLVPEDEAESEWTAQGASDQEGDEMPDADEEFTA